MILAVMVLAALTSPALAQETFSGATGGIIGPGDIIGPGPSLVLSAPAIAAGFALTGAEINGLSDGMDPFNDMLYFSVDHASVGLPATAVESEAIGGGAGFFDHPADVYETPLTGTNTLFRDGNGIANPGVAPPLGLTEPYTLFSDNLDAYDFGGIGGPGPIYFTVGAASPAGLMTDTIYFVPTPGGPIGVFAPGAALGLMTVDDIDAIFIEDLGTPGVFDAADTVGFSLAPGSTSLASGSALDVTFGVGGASSAAGVFVITPGFTPTYIPAGVLGLAFTDNVDALETVPEPATMGLLAIGAAALIRRKRR